MGEFSPPLFLSPFSFFSYPSNIEIIFDFSDIISKFTPHFKFLDPPLFSYGRKRKLIERDYGRTKIYQGRPNSSNAVNDRYLSFWWSIPIARRVICGKGALQNGIFSAQQAYDTFNVHVHVNYPSCSLYIHRIKL